MQPATTGLTFRLLQTARCVNDLYRYILPHFLKKCNSIFQQKCDLFKLKAIHIAVAPVIIRSVGSVEGDMIIYSARALLYGNDASPASEAAVVVIEFFGDIAFGIENIVYAVIRSLIKAASAYEIVFSVEMKYRATRIRTAFCVADVLVAVKSFV